MRSRSRFEGGGDFERCAWAIFLAALFDGLDGRVARKTRTSTKFGTEYDSLSDLVSFGVAPAVVTFLWALRGLGRVGWLAAFLYMACGALRLARFNVQSTSIEKKFFQGLPIPMAALMMVGAILIWEGQAIGLPDLKYAGDVRYYILAMTYLLAVLMVSNIPYRSFKSLELTGKHPFYYLVLILVGFTIWATKPLVLLFMIGALYVLSGPMERFIFSNTVRAYKSVTRRRAIRRAAADEKVPDSTPQGEDGNVHTLRLP